MQYILKEDFRNWDRIGISLGDGTVIHAWDRVRVDGYLEIENLPPAPGWTPPKYLGWTPVVAHP